MKDRASSPGDGGGPGNKGSSSQRGSKRKQDLSPRSDPAESHRSSGHHHHSHHHSHPKVPRESEGGDDDRSPLTPDVSIREESQQYNSNTATSRSNASAADHHSRSSTDYPDWPTGAGVDGDPAAAAAAVAAAAASYDDRNPSIQAALMGKNVHSTRVT